ncbi:MAG: radical SAM/SPASM domain-containing protein [Elusimicrobia bacterium]|nr:radical SAM/SPASM domain-containing protein [Elusimicrobiota bacterium]
MTGPARDFRFARKTLPYRMFATWNIHYDCDYRCRYCHAPKPGKPGVRDAAYIKAEDWLRVWEGLYERYGTWEVLVSGGEPFTYPGFMDLLIGLSRVHLMGVCTNLGWDVERFVKEADPQRVRIETSFHPESAKLEDFTGKLKRLKAHGFEPTVNFVPWPPLLHRLGEVKAAMEGAGCQVTLQPFIGEWEGRRYPQGYTDDEKRALGIFKDECNEKTVDFKTTAKADSTKGRLCRMGQNYVFIHPDGEVSRCCRDHTFSLGNLAQGTFKLLDEAVPCAADNCNCWRCMVTDREDFWWRHWGRYHVTDLAMAAKGKRP